jgi:peroxiredoxin
MHGTGNVKMMVTAALCVCATVVVAEGLDIGDQMPKEETAMKSTEGKMLMLDDVAGEKGTLVIFSCNHCPFVQAWEERMVKIGNECMKQGVGVVFINSNDAEKYPTDDLAHMKEQAAEEGYEFPYVVDATSDVARAFGAKRTPEVFLFDAQRRLVYHGAVDDNTYKPNRVEKHYLRDAIDALLAGSTIPVKETKSVGCSIKFRGK